MIRSLQAFVTRKKMYAYGDRKMGICSCTLLLLLLLLGDILFHSPFIVFHIYLSFILTINKNLTQVQFKHITGSYKQTVQQACVYKNLRIMQYFTFKSNQFSQKSLFTQSIADITKHTFLRLGSILLTMNAINLRQISNKMKGIFKKISLIQLKKYIYM